MSGTECLALDQGILLDAIFPGDFSREDIAALQKQVGIVKKMTFVATLVLKRHSFDDVLSRLWTHSSDTARGWACYIAAQWPNASLTERLDQLRVFADDSHFGVREWAWLAIRPQIVHEPLVALEHLANWTSDGSERVRRFASEATRPRGVWSAHIAILRCNPALGLPLLEPLKTDPSVYVSDSVANWLNDAAKDRPDFVQDLCAQWLRMHPGPVMERPCRRALRSLKEPTKKKSKKQ